MSKPRKWRSVRKPSKGSKKRDKRPARAGKRDPLPKPRRSRHSKDARRRREMFAAIVRPVSGRQYVKARKAAQRARKARVTQS